jgi:hypothetical protein
MPDIGPDWELQRDVPGDSQPLRRHSLRPVTALPRNGLPELPPYVYQGTGADVLAGSYGDPLLDEADTEASGDSPRRKG